jgi:hypothetical protein
MARPMTPDQTVLALRRWRVPFQTVEGWRTRNRNHRQPWGPVHGLMIHHTGDDAADTTDLALVTRGRADLPGPLAQFGCDDTGTIWLIGCGRANHAGGGDPRVLRAVIEEGYGERPPRPHEHTGSPGATDGNVCFYGVEAFYSGRNAPSAQARRSLVLLAAAICHHHGWSGKSVIGHKEWSDWKSDPGALDMSSFRRSVAGRLLEGPPPQVVEADIYLKRARRRLESAHDDLLVAHENLTLATGEGAKVGRIRERTHRSALSVREDASRLRRRQT